MLRLALIPVVVAFVLAGAPAASAGQAGHAHGGSGHPHGGIEVGDSASPPACRMTVHPDAKQGWNLQVQVENFRWAPEHANQPHVAGEGHAHLYVNGRKVTRLYGEWYYLERLPAGKNTILVTLNANTHDDYLVKGKPVSATEMVTVEKK